MHVSTYFFFRLISQLNRHQLASLFVIMGISLGAISQASAAINPMTYIFDVKLNNKNIGEHTFELSPLENGVKVLSQSTMAVDVLFIRAFSYQHNAEEIWQNGCLQQIVSQTSTNGKTTFVNAGQTGQGLSVNTQSGEQTINECVGTFAYWDIDRLAKQQLLNPQTGEYTQVSLKNMGEEQFSYQDQNIMATRYVLTTPTGDIQLWYSQNKEWLGLATKVKGGRTLLYSRN